MTPSHELPKFLMRKPCTKCGGQQGRIETRGGQDCVYCLGCVPGTYQYNAPRPETGRKERSMETIHAGLGTAKRARILVRANTRCELCGHTATAEYPLHVGHLLSVKDGMALGLTETDLNDDENLAALCMACNLGIGETTIPLRLAASIVIARLKNRMGKQ